MATKAIQVELLLGGVMDDGDVALANGKVFTYAAGTLTNKPTWIDRDKTTLATNPIILDAAGKAVVFADGVYKFVIKDADGVTIPVKGTIDNLEFGTALTGTVSFSKGADIVSSSALTIGTDGNYFDITGITAITSINAVGVGTVVKLHFDDALTLTHHATNLILPGAKNITTAAGDEAEFIEYATGNWICTNYQRTNGNPIINSIVRQLKGADIASANALQLGTNGNYFDITGATAITSINSLGVGTIIKIHFDGALTLTHHATDLILPGGVNITTAAGDEAEFIEYASGDWRCTKYSKASGESVVQIVEAGTSMIFFQAAAPTGWTQDTTHTNKGLRVVDGAGGGDGGTLDFDNATVSNHTLATGSIPSHTHAMLLSNTGGNGNVAANASAQTHTAEGGSKGGGGAHNHGLDLKYIDVIVATKD